jgi:hypothetical protein
VIQATSEGLEHARDDETRFGLLRQRGLAFGTLQVWNLAIRDLEAARRIHAEPFVLVQLGKAYFAMEAYSSAGAAAPDRAPVRSRRAVR